MNKCTSFRIPDETRDIIDEIKDHFGLKTPSAVLNEVFYYFKYGKNYPGSNADIGNFLKSVLSGELIGTRTFADKVNDRQRELYQHYISILDNEYGSSLLRIIAVDGVKKALEANKSRWMLNIQFTIMKECDVGLLDSEVVDLCKHWYYIAKNNGKISEIQKDIISQKLDDWEKYSDLRDAQTLTPYTGGVSE